jgi:hypothetical protein
MKKEANKNFFKRFWWIFLVLIIIILLLVIFFTTSAPGANFIGKSLINKAEIVLSNGITIQDEQNDFVGLGEKDKPGEKPNNPNPYNFSYYDVKSASIAIDDEYLYCKIQFQQTIPQKPDTVPGDFLEEGGTKFNLVDEKGKDLVVLHMGYGFIPFFNYHTIGSSYSYGPTGIEEPEEARFCCRGNDARVFGGPGTDYLIGIYPLKHLNLSKGQIIYFAVSFESSSRVYDHAAVDVLGGSGKMPAIITWNTSTNEFIKDDDFYSKGENYQNLK